MKSKLQSGKDSAKNQNLEPFDSQKKWTQTTDKLENPVRLLDILICCNEQTRAIALITELLEDINQTMGIINFNLHSIIGTRADKKKLLNKF